MGQQIMLDQATAQRLQQTQQAEMQQRIFRAQFSMGVLGNEQLMKLAADADSADASKDDKSAGETKAQALRNLALDAAQAFFADSDEDE